MTAVYEASPVKRNRRTKAELAVIDDAIVTAVAAEKPVSLRGVYYRVVSAGVVEKTEKAYGLIGRELLKLRRDGRVNYADITDGTRWIFKPDSWDGLESALADAAASYRRALWHDQHATVMVFTEKDAISGVLLPVTSRWDVALGVVRGYASETFAWSVAQSARNAEANVYVYQFGDHDPSGVDAWRDFTAKVTAFAGEGYADDPAGWLSFERIAVTPGQVTSMSLPTRPTKEKDTRAAGFDGESVEVDAIPATELRRLCEDAITAHIDMEQLRITRIAEASEREIFQRMTSS